MEEQPQDWHLSKTVSLSHILSTVALLLGAVAGYVSFSNRLAVLESQFLELNVRVVRVLESQARVDSSQDAALHQFRAEMREDVREIQSKLDRLIEAQIPRNGR